MHCRHAFFTTESVNDGKKQWLMGLMRSLQKYNLYCHATESQLQSYLMGKYEAFLEQERTEDDWPLKLAANVVGLQKIDPEDPFVQESGMNPTIRVWVLNSQVQISETGQLIDPTASPFVWIEGQRRTQSGSHSIARQKFASIVRPIAPQRSALRNVIQVMQRAFLNNFPSCLLVLAAHLLNLHYESLLPVVGGIPIAILYGDVQCGKSTATKVCLSLTGTQDSHFLGRCPDVTFIRATTQTTLGLVLDDPTNHTAISEKIMLLFDGKTIEQNSVSLHPRTSFMTSINMPCFEKLAKHHRYMNVKFVYDSLC